MQTNNARHLTSSEWKANARQLASKPRPFPPIARYAHRSDCKDGYFQTTDGRWWTENGQVGYVEVLPTSRALVFTLALLGMEARL